MEKSQVYFTDMHASYKENLQQKLSRLIKAAGIGNIDFNNKNAAIKIHFGEPGNLAYLRPNYARTVADTVKDLGGRPFLTDCNTLYPGSRKNALEHLDAAYLNGFSPFSTGCHVLIGDGLKGTDEVIIPVQGGNYINKAKIGHAVMDADIIISLAHFKGHVEVGFGGTLKNVGMGCASRAGKMDLHSSGKPIISQKRCTGCGLCIKNCAHDAILLVENKAVIDPHKCTGCGHCIGICSFYAVQTAWDEAQEVLGKKIAEYAWAVLNGRPHFHINLVIDVSPLCDCSSGNDVPIVADIGMFASFDPVALDLACADAVNAQKPLPGSILEGKTGADHFNAIHPKTNWRAALEHANKIGLGSLDYELITI